MNFQTLNAPAGLAQNVGKLLTRPMGSGAKNAIFQLIRMFQHLLKRSNTMSATCENNGHLFAGKINCIMCGAENKTPQSPHVCGDYMPPTEAFAVLKSALACYSPLVKAIESLEIVYQELAEVNDKMSYAMAELTAENNRLIEQLNIAVDHIHEMHGFSANKRGDAGMVHIKSGLALNAIKNLYPQSDERTEWKGQPEL